MTKLDRVFVLGGLLMAGALAAFLSPFASKSPDGLERVAMDQGFIGRGEAMPAWRWAVVSDYLLPGVRNESVATGAAGLVGAMVVFGSAYGVARLARRTKGKEESHE